MAVTLPLTPIVIFYIQYSLPDTVITLLLVLFFSVGFVGLMIALYYGLGSAMLFHGMDILRLIAPPEPFIERKFAILNKDPVYAIAQWGSNALFFVAFYQSERTFEQKVSVPKVIWKWEYNHPIGENKVARREGNFTVPVDRGTYYAGDGILYALLLEQTRIVTYQKNFTKEELSQIVDSLKQEVIAFGSGRKLVDDEF